MEGFSPKIEIINYFDNLINRIDIDIDSCLEKFNGQQLLSELLSAENDRKNFRNRCINFDLQFFDTFDSSKPNPDSWPESTKVVDYLKQIRMKTIEELKKAQEKTLEYYKYNSERFKREQNNEKSIEELRSDLFAENFYFQVNLNKRLWAFNVFTIVTDFYMSPFYIKALENLINDEREPFGQQPIFDDKIVLTGLLYKFFIMNLLNFPNHVIYVRKQDVSNIESIEFDFKHKHSGLNLTSSSSIDLSKLVNIRIIDRYAKYSSESAKPVKFNVEGLCSLKTLHLEANTSKVDFSIKNLPSLAKLFIYIYGTIDEDIVTRILDQVQQIEELYLEGHLSFFNLDHLSNLKDLSLDGTIDQNFNFELIKYLCNQLENLKIVLTNIDEKKFVKLFDGYIFPYLLNFAVRYFYINRLKKEFINRFPMLRHLIITDCEIKEIDPESFSNLDHLCLLDLRSNRIEYIEKDVFSKLKNLENINLSYNYLRYFDPKFIGLRESVEFNIEHNNI